MTSFIHNGNEIKLSRFSNGSKLDDVYLASYMTWSFDGDIEIFYSVFLSICI